MTPTSNRSKRFITRRVLRVFGIPAFIFSCALCTSAVTITDYQTRLESSRKNLDTVISVLRSNELGANIDSYIHETMAGIKKSLPESETVEFRGTSVNTSNGWIRAKFDEFDREPRTSERISILASVSERLFAISEHIRDLESTSALARTKDEDKQKLAEILSREEYQKPQKAEPSLFERLVTKILDWLRDLFPSPNISPAVPAEGLQPLSVVLQVLIYGAIIGLVGFLIYKFAPVVMARFGSREKKDRGDRVVLGEHIDASVSARDLFSEAETLARRGDLRGAIRKGYIALLCDLADRKVIGLARYKTNRDYLRDVRKRPTLFERMKHATGNFEQHWYGVRQPEPKDWEDFREQYQKAVSEV
jgi:Domain of unknown function (DUF4129)